MISQLNSRLSPADSNERDNQTYSILSLSGGGFRGLFTIKFLAEIEKKAGRPLAHYFDLICGTSIGGILALALACEIPCEKLEKVFLENSSKIFNLRFKSQKLTYFLSLFQSRYTSEGLCEILEQFFGKRKIGDLNHRILIPAVDLFTGRGRIFKTPHHQSLTVDQRLRLVDVALATSAAPTFFAPHKIEGRTFVDGALLSNDPALFAVHEIRQFIHPAQPPNISQKQHHIQLLSVGTMEPMVGLTNSSNTGFLYWCGIRLKGSNKTPRILDLMYSVQQHSVDFQLRHLLGSDYVKFDSIASAEQSSDIALDRYDGKAISILASHALSEAQTALGSGKLEKFLKHVPLPPVWPGKQNPNPKV